MRDFDESDFREMWHPSYERFYITLPLKYRQTIAHHINTLLQERGAGGETLEKKCGNSDALPHQKHLESAKRIVSLYNEKPLTDDSRLSAKCTLLAHDIAREMLRVELDTMLDIARRARG